MGVYHLMGLGLSAGSVIGPLTYLAHRYRRWNEEDREFFGTSGEQAQRKRGEKVGDVEALVLFTTREVLEGTIGALPYVDNSPGRIAAEPKRAGGPMKEVLGRLLRREWPAISGGRPKGTVYWCEVDRRDFKNCYERINQVIAALKNVGGLGKEIWINLTSGTNVMNMALKLAANLSGEVARLYYGQAENEQAEKCVRFTAEEGYWLDLPVMPLALSPISEAILTELGKRGPTSQRDLYSLLKNKPDETIISSVTSEETLRQAYLIPLSHQRLIEGDGDLYTIGPQWERIRFYQERWKQARDEGRAIGQLVEQEDWISKEEIPLK